MHLLIFAFFLLNESVGLSEEKTYIDLTQYSHSFQSYIGRVEVDFSPQEEKTILSTISKICKGRGFEDFGIDKRGAFIRCAGNPVNHLDQLPTVLLERVVSLLSQRDNPCEELNQPSRGFIRAWATRRPTARSFVKQLAGIDYSKMTLDQLKQALANMRRVQNSIATLSTVQAKNLSNLLDEAVQPILLQIAKLILKDPVKILSVDVNEFNKMSAEVKDLALEIMQKVIKTLPRENETKKKVTELGVNLAQNLKEDNRKNDKLYLGILDVTKTITPINLADLKRTEAFARDELQPVFRLLKTANAKLISKHFKETMNITKKFPSVDWRGYRDMVDPKGDFFDQSYSDVTVYSEPLPLIEALVSHPDFEGSKELQKKAIQIEQNTSPTHPGGRRVENLTDLFRKYRLSLKGKAPLRQILNDLGEGSEQKILSFRQSKVKSKLP